MSDDQHFRKLERVYHEAPTNRYYAPKLRIEEGRATLEIPLREELWHAGRAVHGSVLFKALDDAAFFAANSLVEEVFVLTASFTVDFLRPVAAGTIRAEGRVVDVSRRRILADAELHDQDGRLVARGRGSFMRSSIALGPEVGYR